MRIAASAAEPEPLIFRIAWVLPAGAGALAGFLLAGLYLGLVSWAQGFSHTQDLLWDDRYFVAAIAGGFAVQVGLFVYVRRLLSRRARGGAPGAPPPGPRAPPAVGVGGGPRLTSIAEVGGVTVEGTWLTEQDLEGVDADVAAYPMEEFVLVEILFTTHSGDLGQIDMEK